MEVIYKCRACLTEQDAMLSLFDIYEHGLTLAMILQNCIGSEIREDQDLPSYLCDSCILVLTQFYNFTIVYEQSEKMLRSAAKANKSISNTDTEKYGKTINSIVNIKIPQKGSVGSMAKSKQIQVPIIITEEQVFQGDVINECEIETEREFIEDDAEMEDHKACDSTMEESDDINDKLVDVMVKHEVDTVQMYKCKRDVQYITADYLPVMTDSEAIVTEVEILMDPINESMECEQDLSDTEHSFIENETKYVSEQELSHSNHFFMEQQNKITDPEDLKPHCLLNETEVVSISQNTLKKYKTPPAVIQKPQPNVKINEAGESFEEITKYECNTCGESYLYQSSFQNHMRVKHELNDVNAEDYCTKFFVKVHNETNASSSTYEDEKNLTNEPEHECNICSKKFHFSYLLQQHMQTHDPNKKFVCEICGSSFIRKTYLIDHKEGHSTEKKHVCKFCGKAFKRRTVLRAHKRVHTHPNHYVCEVCGRGFTNNSTLKTHKLLIHIRERKFKCLICGQAFPLKATLNKHIRRHQNKHKTEKDFKCSLCNMQYRDKSSLKRHIESKHEGKIKLLQCSYCPKQYTSKTNLFKHNRRYHIDVDSNLIKV